MRGFLSRAVLLIALAVITSAIAVGSAAADPSGSPKSSVISINCGTNGTYWAVVNGNGKWGPAHDVNSTEVLIPIAFGPFTFTVTDPEGNVVDSGINPGSTKGSASPKGHALIDCVYSIGDTNTEGFTFSGSGGVTGFIS